LHIFATPLAPLCNGDIGHFSVTRSNVPDKDLQLVGSQIDRPVDRLAEAEEPWTLRRVPGYTKPKQVDMTHSGYIEGTLGRCYANRVYTVFADLCA
jgi:hypothetical protein